jgi:hypothetical protein
MDYTLLGNVTKRLLNVLQAGKVLESFRTYFTRDRFYAGKYGQRRRGCRQRRTFKPRKLKVVSFVKSVARASKSKSPCITMGFCNGFRYASILSSRFHLVGWAS